MDEWGMKDPTESPPCATNPVPSARGLAASIPPTAFRAQGCGTRAQPNLPTCPNGVILLHSGIWRRNRDCPAANKGWVHEPSCWVGTRRDGVQGRRLGWAMLPFPCWGMGKRGSSTTKQQADKDLILNVLNFNVFPLIFIKYIL